jgi:serralysin
VAKVKVRFVGEQSLLGLLGSDYVLADSSKNQFVFEMTDGGGAVTRIVAEGDGFVVKNGLLEKGLISHIEFQDDKQKPLVELSALKLEAEQFHSAIADAGVQPLLELIFSGNDKISSSAYATSIFTGAGNDTVKFSGRGYVEFIDGQGNDRYIGSAFNEEIDNTVSYAQAGEGTSGIDANLETGVIIDPWGTQDTYKNINVIIGSINDDVVTSSPSDSRMKFTGQAGNDTFVGNTEIDAIDYRQDAHHGGSGVVFVNLAEGWATDGFGDNDTLSGIERVLATSGNDTIIGSSGSEQLEGWTGDDTLTGGTGPDVFRFRDDWGIDTVTDFEVGVDKIRLNDVSDLFDGFDGLSITQDGANAVITLIDDDANGITLLNIDARSLSISDFIL